MVRLLKIAGLEYWLGSVVIQLLRW